MLAISRSSLRSAAASLCAPFQRAMRCWSRGSHPIVVGTVAVIGFQLISFPLAAPAGAALLAYDPFTVGAGPADYVAGDEVAMTGLLGGQNPATGPTPFYTGPWIQNGPDSQVVKDIGSLFYPLFPQAGGQIQETVLFGCCSFGRSGRELTDALGGGDDPRTIYQSFLIDFGTQGTDSPTDFGKRAYEMWNGGIGDAYVAVDLFMNHFAGINELTFSVTTASGTLSVPVSGGGLTLDALAGTHLIVLKFEFNPADPDVLSLFFDPTNSIEANYLPAALISVANSDLLITHHGAYTGITLSGPGHIPGAFDEVRWGDTFADVTPFLTATDVPEPAALPLFAAGLLGMGLMMSGRFQQRRRLHA